jgi:hypothetical protein
MLQSTKSITGAGPIAIKNPPSWNFAPALQRVTEEKNSAGPTEARFSRS